MNLSEQPLPVKLFIAALYDIADAINIIPVVGDALELGVGSSLAFLLTENPKAILPAAIDGILPAPIDFVPTVTIMVIADEWGWLD